MGNLVSYLEVCLIAKDVAGCCGDCLRKPSLIEGAMISATVSEMKMLREE